MFRLQAVWFMRHPQAELHGSDPRPSAEGVEQTIALSELVQQAGATCGTIFTSSAARSRLPGESLRNLLGEGWDLQVLATLDQEQQQGGRRLSGALTGDGAKPFAIVIAHDNHAVELAARLCQTVGLRFPREFIEPTLQHGHGLLVDVVKGTVTRVVPR